MQCVNELIYRRGVEGAAPYGYNFFLMIFPLVVNVSF